MFYSLSHSFPMDFFCEYRILGWQLRSFRTLKTSLHCLLDSIVSIEKSALSLTFAPLKIMYFFPLMTFNIVFFIVVFQMFEYDSLGIVFLVFILHVVCGASWIHDLSFISFVKLLPLVFEMLLLFESCFPILLRL